MTRNFSTLPLLFCAAAMALLLSACSVSTANIGSLTTSKDEAGAQPSVSFEPADTIYAVATGKNIPSKVTMKWRTYAQKVEGQADNSAIELFDAAFDLPGDGSSTYNLSPPTAGWPAGKYRIEVTMVNEDGKQQDQKAVSVTVAGN